MSRYSQNLSLIDIFNEKTLQQKLPLVRYNEYDMGKGEPSIRTKMLTLGSFVYRLSQRGARPYYKPLITRKMGDMIYIGGNLTGDLDEATNSVYLTILNNKSLLEMTVNQMDMIRDALKEAEKNKRLYGKESNLYLREQSISQIKGLSDKQIARLMRDIIDNIEYSGNYPKTIEKWRKLLQVADKDVNFRRRQRYWENKVGILESGQDE